MHPYIGRIADDIVHPSVELADRQRIGADDIPFDMIDAECSSQSVEVVAAFLPLRFIQFDSVDMGFQLSFQFFGAVIGPAGKGFAVTFDDFGQECAVSAAVVHDMLPEDIAGRIVSRVIEDEFHQIVRSIDAPVRF